MFEYAVGGDSTFVYSAYVHRYVRIEHNTNNYRMLERMSATQSNILIIISYMKSNSFSYVETRQFERNAASLGIGPSIQICCITFLLSMLVFVDSLHLLNEVTYQMYQNYIDFVSICLPNQLFDFVLLDGCARPQLAYTVLKNLNGDNAKIYIHDWNYHIEYHLIVREFYKLAITNSSISKQAMKNWPFCGEHLNIRGGGGGEKIDQIQWKFLETPR